MQDGFERSSLLMECIMPSYKSLIVTLQRSSTSKDWLLTLLLLVPSKERPSLLATMAMSAGQGYEGPWPLEDKADTSGPPELFAEIASWHPEAGVTDEVTEGTQVMTVSFPPLFSAFLKYSSS